MAIQSGLVAGQGTIVRSVRRSEKIIGAGDGAGTLRASAKRTNAAIVETLQTLRRQKAVVGRTLVPHSGLLGLSELLFDQPELVVVQLGLVNRSVLRGRCMLGVGVLRICIRLLSVQARLGSAQNVQQTRIVAIRLGLRLRPLQLLSFVLFDFVSRLLQEVAGSAGVVQAVVQLLPGELHPSGQIGLLLAVHRLLLSQFQLLQFFLEVLLDQLFVQSRPSRTRCVRSLAVDERALQLVLVDELVRQSVRLVCRLDSALIRIALAGRPDRRHFERSLEEVLLVQVVRRFDWRDVHRQFVVQVRRAHALVGRPANLHVRRLGLVQLGHILGEITKHVQTFFVQFGHRTWFMVGASLAEIRRFEIDGRSDIRFGH